MVLILAHVVVVVFRGSVVLGMHRVYPCYYSRQRPLPIDSTRLRPLLSSKKLVANQVVFIVNDTGPVLVPILHHGRGLLHLVVFVLLN